MGTTNNNTGVNVAVPPAAPFAAPTLPDVGAVDYGQRAVMESLWADRPAGFAGNRGREGIEAEAYVIGYADSQYDLPINLVARIPPGRSFAQAGTLNGFSYTDTDVLLAPPAQQGGAPSYMRPSDDLAIFERDLEGIQRWLLGAP